MAITQTKKIQRIEVYPGYGEDEQPRLMVVEDHFFDDPDDAELPVTSTKVYHLGENDDVSGKLQLVQDVYNSVITYTPVEPADPTAESE